jgi:hypothetical protein
MTIHLCVQAKTNFVAQGNVCRWLPYDKSHPKAKAFIQHLQSLGYIHQRMTTFAHLLDHLSFSRGQVLDFLHD